MSRAIENCPYWGWAGDTQLHLPIGESMSLNLFLNDDIPDAAHLIPFESYVGSRFSGCGVWRKELAFCQLLATGRLLHWESDSEVPEF